MKKVDYYQTGAGREVIDEIEDNLGALGTAFSFRKYSDLIPIPFVFFRLESP